MGEREVYISADVEADGPIPGPFSMLDWIQNLMAWDGKG